LQQQPQRHAEGDFRRSEIRSRVRPDDHHPPALRCPMRRRSFMQGMLVAAAAGSVPGFLRAETLTGTAPERFAAGLARNPWLAGWKSGGVESLAPHAAGAAGG